LVWLPLAVVIAGGVGVPAAMAVDFVHDSVPGRWTEALVPEDLPALVLPKYLTDYERARAQCEAGRYKLSLQTLRSMRDAGKADPAAVAVVKARDLEAVGEGEAALAVVSDAGVAAAPSAQLERAAVLSSLGRDADAIALLRDLLRARPDSLAGHLALGQAAERMGDLETARGAYGWFVAPPQDYLEKWRGRGERLFEDDPTSAENAVMVGRALDRWATLTGQYARDPGLNDTILDIFVKTYDVIRRGYGPAHLAAAEDYVSHDDAEDAQKEAKVALGANPNDSGAIALLGKLAVMGFNFDAADGAVDALRLENPTSLDADLLEVRNLLRQRQPKQAEATARRILDRRPKQIEAMELLAAAAALQLHDAQTASLLKNLDEVSPGNAGGCFEVAEQLSAMRQYPRGAAMYQSAIDRAPWWTSPRNGLGLLYTQSGDEDLARATLDAAHALDPYDLETTNYLRLLDQLAGFARKESAHFVVEYDPQLDPVIPEYFSDYLESVYPAVTSEYHTEPARKTIIEVFPTHDAFSVRTTGTPWIGTVGASTGRIIAMVAPRKGENTQGPFNWSQVLRHEFTHTVTLAATDNRISHWMTEGLAVMEEHSPLQWAWVPMLYHAVTTHELFDMDQLTWAFVRPRKPSDRQLAYARTSKKPTGTRRS
jgi:tetratricopeptide (TPR) repeat protein